MENDRNEEGMEFDNVQETTKCYIGAVENGEELGDTNRECRQESVDTVDAKQGQRDNNKEAESGMCTLGRCTCTLLWRLVTGFRIQ